MDPFAVFGDDSDADDNEGACLDNNIGRETESDRVIQSLISLTNRTRRAPSLQPPTQVDHPFGGNHSKDVTEAIDSPSNLDNEISLPWDEPLYMGRIKIVESLPFGGGRGVVAEQQLAPGTLVLVEEPLMTWSVEESQHVDLRTVYSILVHEKARDIVQALEHFYPTKHIVDTIFSPTGTMRGDAPISDAQEQQIIKMLDNLRSSPDDIKYCHDDFNQDVDDILDTIGSTDQNQENNDEINPTLSPSVPMLLELATARNLIHTNGTNLTEIDVWRLVLAVRYNGLESGIYLYAALINHSDQPNCVKFRPNSEETTHTQARSEVRTTRTLARGEVLTISYLPRILSHASRRKHLWEQHRFDIGVPAVTPKTVSGDVSSLYRMELIGNRLPPSSWHTWDENSTTHRIELSIAGLESIFLEASGSTHQSSNSSRSDVAAARFEQIKALEQACLELCTESQQQLQNPQHILLLPCFRLHVDACDLVQQNDFLSLTDRLALLVRLIQSAQRLMVLQSLLWGSDHFDIARTSLDLAQAIDELLTRSPRHLHSLNTVLGEAQSTGSPSAWAAYEYKLQQNYKRIKALYPRDVDEYMNRITNR